MNILYIAPLPPPITGHAIVSEALKDELAKNHYVNIVDLSKNSLKEGITGLRRIIQVLNIFNLIFKKKKKADVIYFTISESISGNIKDIIIYLICFHKLKNTYIHLHGGSIKCILWDKNPFLDKVNRFFIKRLGGVIVTGKSHISIFENIIDTKKIHVVPNFAPDFLFVKTEEVRLKFKMANPLRILFMSNLIPKKGYLDLLEAFLQIDKTVQKKIQIDFAGAFNSEEEEKWFMNKILPFEQVSYHGKVDKLPKKKLFNDAHVFCLPTSYFEGQPVSILEAYASGCVVLTTGKEGIKDIFENNINGLEIKAEAPLSIVAAINCLLNMDTNDLCAISIANLYEARLKYRLSIYSDRIKEILTQQY